MNSVIQKSTRIIIKVGSSLVTNDGRGLDHAAIARWAMQIAGLRALGKQVVLVSSGAIAEGMLRLDQAFDKALAQMLSPLSEQRKVEMAKREELIAEAEQLQPSDRHTLDNLRRLQERWQEQAKALPLERKAEQALWQRFRAACDAIFAKRKETAHAADHERKAHLHAREAICKELETASFSGEDKAQLAAIAQTLRDAAAAWNAAGIVPRAAEAKITQQQSRRRRQRFAGCSTQSRPH